MIVSVIGQDTLAAATLECCLRHFAAHPYPMTVADVIWFCYDTPIGRNDEPDVEWVMGKIRDQLHWVGTGTIVLISSQIPVGSTKILEVEFPHLTFAYQPENIRVKTAVADFKDQARVVIGTRGNDLHKQILSELFAPFTKKIIFTDPETAEMSKAALNCWLAMNIAFINEIGRVCAVVGADVAKVSETLLSEARISPKAPLRAGPPFGGGHLAREVFNLTQIAEKNKISIPIISNIKESNQ